MERRDQWVGGAVLIVIGAGLLLGQLVGNAGQFILLGIGVLLLVLFAISRNPGTLIGGGILIGLGVVVIGAAFLRRGGGSSGDGASSGGAG